ncbi:MAG: hypothetical protein MZU84_08280 [Sphingobacterium sp.]|nr:hypothetical protein [Sphingobacterium sp.]
MDPSTLRKARLVSPPLAAAFAVCLTLSAFAQPPQARVREQRDPSLVQGAQAGPSPRRTGPQRISQAPRGERLRYEPRRQHRRQAPALHGRRGHAPAQGRRRPPPSQRLLHGLLPRRRQRQDPAAHRLRLQRRPRLRLRLAAHGRLRPAQGRPGR